MGEPKPVGKTPFGGNPRPDMTYLPTLIRVSVIRWLVAWCAWLWNRKPSCCCRVSAGDQLTSVSLPAWRGHVFKCSESPGVV